MTMAGVAGDLRETGLLGLIKVFIAAVLTELTSPGEVVPGSWISLQTVPVIEGR